MENFTNLHYVLALITLSYGITLGFGNTFRRVYAVLINRALNQSILGRLWDTLFYSSIGYLILIYFGVIV